MAVDTIYLKNEQGVDVGYPIGADSRNVTYSPNAETVEGSVHKELQQNNIHKNTIIANSTGVHGLRYTDNKLQVQAPGGSWTPIDFGTGDMKKADYDDPSQNGVIAIAHGGTGNTSGYVRAGAKSGSTIGVGATAEGSNNEAIGDASHAEGSSNTATGNYSHAEGFHTSAGGTTTHAEGFHTGANGIGCHVGGMGVAAFGNGTFLHGVAQRGEGVQDYQITYGGSPNSDEQAAYFVIVDGQAQKFNGDGGCYSDTAFALTPSRSIIRNGNQLSLLSGCYLEIPEKQAFDYHLNAPNGTTYFVTVSLFDTSDSVTNNQPAHSLNYIIVAGYNPGSTGCIVPLNTDSNITNDDFLIATYSTDEFEISGANTSNFKKIVQAIRLN